MVFISVSFAETDFSRIDNHADRAPNRLKKSIPALVNYLIRPAKSDLEKVRAIFRWITQNINYDVEAYFDHRLIVEDPKRIIRRGKAVCGGYSELFNRLCKEAGIQSKLIGGWSKGYGERLTGRPNHAWNAVKINYRWYLLDATWGAGHLDSGQKFVREFNNHYFLTDPEQLIYDHLPEDETWQLIKQAITRKQFSNLVLLRPAFFRNGLKLKSHLNSQITAKNELSVEIEAPENTYISARLLLNNELLEEQYNFTQRHNGLYSIQTRFPEKGNYTLRLFTKIGSETEKYNWACDYNVIVSETKENEKFFTKQYGKFFDLDVFVHRPLNFSLLAGEERYFKLGIENIKEVAIVVNEELFPLKKAGNLFEGSVIIPKGPLHVVVKEDDSKYNYWILEYEGK